MIKKPTTILTGAGTSIPFGYPSGPSLVDKIIYSLNEKPCFIGGYSDKDHPITREYNKKKYQFNSYELYSKEFEQAEIVNFREALAGSNADSIDFFLDNRPEFLKIGKFAIANILLQYEDKDEISFQKENWLKYIWGHLSRGGRDNFSHNRLKIYTFNYDRLLEYYLFTSIQNLFGTDEAKTMQLLETIQIVHLHGRLCPLPWEDTEGFKYGFDHKNPGEHLSKIIQSIPKIKLISEVKDIREQTEILSSFNTSKQRFILGYGFHDLTMKALQLQEIKQNVFCTAFGLYENEMTSITDKYDVKFSFHPQKSIELLRNRFRPE